MNPLFLRSTLLVMALLTIPARAVVRLPNVICDNMVLQQNSEITLWGWADNGNEVDVKTSWGQSAKTQVESDGSWKLMLKTPPAHPLTDGLHPETITFTMPNQNTIQIRNVLIGEVWLCAGQSNMVMMNRPGYPAGWCAWYGEQFWKNQESKNANRPYLRIFNVENTMAISPQADVKGCLPGIGLEPEDANGLVRERKNGWQPCTPDTADDISAVPYYFGAALAEKLQVPVGLVTSSVGGSPIRRWMKGGNIFNGMIAPFGPMYLKGVVWYQGESDIGDPAGVYASHFTQMIQYWRGEFNNGEMPFYFVQIAPFGNNAAAAQLREEQASALTLKNTGMAVISDVGDPACIHPRNKRDVGRRLARQALSKTYGCPDVIADGPIFKSAQLQGGSTQVTFSDQGGGLVSRDGKSLTCFTIAGSDGKFQPAIAELAGTTVIVTCPHVPQPTEIRFGWGPSDQPNLMSKSGLPAAQFRSAIR